MKRLGIFLRNGFLILVTLSMLGMLVAADWYVRYDPGRKARRLLEVEGVDATIASAVRAAEKGRVFTLQQLDTVEVDLGARDSESGLTPLLAAIRSEKDEAVEFLLERERVRASLDVSAKDDGRNALALALANGDFVIADSLAKLGADLNVRWDAELPLTVQAYREENWGVLDFLLLRGLDPDETGPDGVALLALAVDSQDGERILQLLEADAEVNAAGITGDSLLTEVVGNNDPDLADLLLSRGAKPNASGASGQTALLAAVKSGSTAMVELLLDHGADPNLAGVDRRSPLSIATTAQDTDAMGALLDAGADATGAALMRTAFRNRDLPSMILLLRSGADPEVKVGRNETLLDQALAGEAVNIARALLEAGASARGKLWSALGTGDVELVEMVLEFGALVSERDTEFGLPLDYALAHGQGKIVALLLDHGANPNVKRDDGESWLAAAIRDGKEPVVTALLDCGACVEGLKSADGHSLLGWAIARGMTDVVERLIAEGADVRAREPGPASKEFIAAFERGKTFRWHLKADSKINPLMLAAAKGDVEMAKLLIAAGARKGEYSRRYLWPINIAAWHMDVDMMQVILGRDPDPDKQPRKVIIDLSSQRATLYENGVATYNTRVSTGKRGYRTPTGTYVISDKHRHHRSTLYDASMPYFMRLSCSAFGLHEGYVPDHAASHGCIRVPRSGAKHLFSKCEAGDVVVIRQ